LNLSKGAEMLLISSSALHLEIVTNLRGYLWAKSQLATYRSVQ